jgi:hypothetical protein
MGKSLVFLGLFAVLFSLAKAFFAVAAFFLANGFFFAADFFSQSFSLLSKNGKVHTFKLLDTLHEP